MTFESPGDRFKAPTPVDAPAAPVRNARLILAEQYAHAEHRRLVHHGGAFRAWDGTCWPEVDDSALKSAVTHRFENAKYEGKNGLMPFNPTPHKVNDIVGALKDVAHLQREIQAPAWLSASNTPPAPANDFVSMMNGLLHLPTRDLVAHTPLYYTHNSVPFPYTPNALAPDRWLRFVNEVLPNDQQAQEALQEIFGYLLTGDTRQQKIFGFIGPRRSGKGTCGRILTQLIGAHNVVGPTTDSLARPFGLQPLIGKSVAIVSDARFHGDQSILTERLLTISGEDTVTIDRKYMDAETVKMSTRFLMLSNEIPKLADASGALASRFVLIAFSETFYGREDTELDDALEAELPGILNWALDGYDRLQARGRFVAPASATELQRELEDLGSPIAAFVRDCCMVGEAYSVGVGDLYRRWEDWCEENHRDYRGTSQSFSRDLHAAVPKLKTVQRGGRHGRVRTYEGVGNQKL